MSIDKDAVGYAPDHPAVLASLEAMTLGRKSWDAARDECYAWLRVSNAIDPDASSNVGRRNIGWVSGDKGRGACYMVQLRGPWGRKAFKMAAPKTIEEARISPLLLKVVKRRDSVHSALIAEFGESNEIVKGLHAAIETVLNATEQGRDYLAAGKSAHRDGPQTTRIGRIAALIATAKAYSVDEWSPNSSREAHIILRRQADRVEILSQGITARGAEDLLAARQHSEKTNVKPNPFRPVTSVRSHTRNDLPEDLKLELGVAYEMGIPIEAIVEFYTSMDDGFDAVAA